MKLAIMQPYFLPYIGYWQMIKAVDTYVIYDDVNFIKGGWINRNKMLVGGKEFLFNLLLKGASPNKLINEVEVDSNQTKLIKTIQCAYTKAPYYSVVMPLMEKVLTSNETNLAKFIGQSIIDIAKYLNLPTTFVYSSEIDKNCSLKAQEKVIHICEVLGARYYYNAIGGQELYNKEDFKNQGIELKFLKTNPVQYDQFKNEFVPWLSILDVMMFNSPEKINAMLDNYELI